MEYGDFECPYSRRAYPIVEDVQARMGDHMRFVFRNFPLTSLHPHAEHAAEVAEAAADLRSYAETLGLDLERFDQELAEHVHAGSAPRGPDEW